MWIKKDQFWNLFFDLTNMYCIFYERLFFRIWPQCKLRIKREPCGFSRNHSNIPMKSPHKILNFFLHALYNFSELKPLFELSYAKMQFLSKLAILQSWSMHHSLCKFRQNSFCLSSIYVRFYERTVPISFEPLFNVLRSCAFFAALKYSIRRVLILF